MNLVVATVCLAFLTPMSLVRVAYRLARWDDCPNEDNAEQMYAAGISVLMAVLSAVALVALTRS